MKDWKVKIVINAPIGEVFEYTTNPQNTHLWIEGIKEETSTEYPPMIGTEYRNTSDGQSWDTYLVIEFEQNKTFTLKKEDGYFVRYTYKELADNETELIYHEWQVAGELNEPFSKGYLQKLKALIETT